MLAGGAWNRRLQLSIKVFFVATGGVDRNEFQAPINLQKRKGKGLAKERILY